MHPLVESRFVIHAQQIVLPSLGYKNDAITLRQRTIELQGKQYERPMIRFAVIMQTACFPQISYRKILVKFSTYPDPLE